MFRIRRVFDDVLPMNRKALDEAISIFRQQFNAVAYAKIGKIPDALKDPFKQRFRSVLYVGEDASGKVKGAALLNHDPELHFCYLDYLAAGRAMSGRGVGGALYQRVREEALLLDVTGLFFECLPDDPALCRDPAMLKQNRARLRFYESFGARPIANTAYETPVKPGLDNPPFLVFDDLGQDTILGRDYVRRVMKCVLNRKYPDICSPEYVRNVEASVRDEPVRLRERRYGPSVEKENVSPLSSLSQRIALVVNDRHEIHQVKDRGYFEAPVRVKTILAAIDKTGLFEVVPPDSFEDRWVTAVHDPAYVSYLKRVCAGLEPSESVYPYVFPLRNRARPPVELPVRVGYYCMDTFTPISRNAFLAARRAVDCALTAATEVLYGRRCAYALVRPPGHHAERSFFGGFCYFNSAAAAAEFLSRHGKVAMLDIDYHHGNGQQQIFYGRRDVLTVSIHGHPSFAFPYFSGFADERGEGDGTGFNFNYPLRESIEVSDYMSALGKAVGNVRDFAPTFLVVCLGLDTAMGDPTGTWPLRAGDFGSMGELVGALGLSTVVVQEGGYDNRSIGANARGFFTGLAAQALRGRQILRS